DEDLPIAAGQPGHEIFHGREGYAAKGSATGERDLSPSAKEGADTGRLAFTELAAHLEIVPPLQMRKIFNDLADVIRTVVFRKVCAAADLAIEPGQRNICESARR